MPKIGRAIKKLVKAVPAVLGVLGGTALGGPAGGMAGGALGHGVTKSDKNKLKGALHGAGAGALYSAIAPTAFTAFGGTPSSTGFLASISGIRHPSLLHQLGFKSAPITGGGIGLFGNLQKGLLEKGMFEKGLLSNMPGGDFLKPHLAGAFSQLRDKQQPIYAEAGTGYDPYGYGESVISHAQPEPMPMMAQAETKQDQEKKQKIQTIMADRHTSPIEKLMQLLQMLEGEQPGQKSAMMARNISHKDISPQKIIASLKNHAPTAPFAGPGLRNGGVVKKNAPRRKYVRGGYVKGKSGGQADDVPVGLKPGSFVMDATTVSLYGDGNSENGAKRLSQDLKKLKSSFMTSSFIKQPPQSSNVRPIAAKVSPGELIIDKKDVDAIGRGDNRAGSRVLDQFRRNLRKHKGVQQFLPKKSKPFAAYAGSVH